MAFDGSASGRQKKVNRKASNRAGLFTDAGIRNLKPEAKQYYERETTGDPETKGFCVRVAPSGTKTFYLTYSLDRKRKNHKLGTYGDEYPLSDARADCRRARALIAEGKDPQTERKKQESALLVEMRQLEAENRATTVNEALEHYLESLGGVTADDVRRLFTNRHCNIKKRIGARKLKEITEDDIEDLLDIHIKRGMLRNAGKLYSYMRAAFTRAKEHRDFRLKGWYSPFNDIKKPRGSDSAPGQRTLPPDEIRIFWKALDQHKINPSYRIILKLMLITGQRLEQTSRMQWSHIDLDEGIWDVPPSEHKTGKRSGVGLVVPLPPTAVQLIKTAHQIEGIDFIFSGPSGNPYYIHSIAKGLKTLLQLVDIPHFTARDLRRTVKTHMARIGILKEIRDRIQGHAMNDIASKHYDRHDYFNEKRTGLLRWEAELNRIIHNQQKSNVVQLRR